MPSFSPTLRYIFENTTPIKLAKTASTATNEVFKLLFDEVSKSTIEEDFKNLCLNLSVREVRLAKKMWDTVKLYGVVNAYSAFVYLSLQFNGVDDISVSGIIEKLKLNLPEYVNSIITCSLEYVKSYVSKGPENDSIKELVLRTEFTELIKNEFLKNQLYLNSVKKSKEKGVNADLLDSMLLAAVDAIIDKFFRVIAPHLKSKDILKYISHSIKKPFDSDAQSKKAEKMQKTLDSYNSSIFTVFLFPSGLDYYFKQCKVYNVPFEKYEPKYPKIVKDVVSKYLKKYIKMTTVPQSPGEETTGVLYFEIFELERRLLSPYNLPIIYYTEYDLDTKTPIRSKFNFDFEKYVSERPALTGTTDKNYIFKFFLRENDFDFRKPTVTKEHLKRYFKPMTDKIVKYISNYGYTNHTNYMSMYDPPTLEPFDILIKEQFELIEYTDKEIRFIQDYYYFDKEGELECTKHNFDFEKYSEDFHVYGTKLEMFTDFVVRSIYISGVFIGVYGYGLPDSLKTYFYRVDNFQEYLTEYSITSHFENNPKNVNNIDFDSYREKNPDINVNIFPSLKTHYYLYGQFEMRKFDFIQKNVTNYDKFRTSIGSIVSVGESSIASGFLYSYSEFPDKIYLVSCFHLIKDGTIIDVIRGSFFNNDETITVDFKIIGYDRFADILVAEFYPNLEYNVSQNNSEKIKKLYKLNMDAFTNVKTGEKVKYMGNMGYDDTESFLEGSIIDENYSGDFKTCFMGNPESIMIDTIVAGGFSGSPIISGDLNGTNINDIKCVGILNSSVSHGRYTKCIKSTIATSIISNIILGDAFFSNFYKNDPVKLNFTQRFGLLPKWLGTIGSYFNIASSVAKRLELRTLPYTGGYVIEHFVVGYDVISGTFVTNPLQLGEQHIIKLETPLLNSKLYRKYIESSNTPIVIKSIRFFENKNSNYNTYQIGKYGKQHGLGVFSYGLRGIGASNLVDESTDYYFNFKQALQDIKIIFYYFNGEKYVEDSETIVSDEDSSYTVNIDGLGNKFFQDKWTFPINLITKLDEYWNNQHLSFDYNDELSSNQMLKQKQQQKQKQCGHGVKCCKKQMGDGMKCCKKQSGDEVKFM
jgi:hypothetical protein